MQDEQVATRYFVTPDQLCVGLFVFVDLPWFKHPFSFKSFKIRSEDQIRTLRGLRLKRIRYDPDRSDDLHFTAAPTQAQAAKTPAERPMIAPEDPVLLGKRARIEKLRERSMNAHIIGCSADARAGDRDAALDAGMNDYLTKPIALEAWQTSRAGMS